MRRLTIQSFIVSICLVLLATGCDNPNMVQDKSPFPNDQTRAVKMAPEISEKDLGPIPNQYTVVFKDQWNGRISNVVGQDVLEFVNARIREFGVPDSLVKSRYQHALRGFTAKLNDQQLQVIKNDPRVDYVEQDRRFKATGFVSSPSASPQTSYAATGMGQTTPWGISRVDGPLDANGLTAYILDSGIDLDHPDLNVDVGNSRVFVDGEPTPEDLFGHGTYVAGILAAKDNSRGVVGVAAGATVVSVKVLDQNGKGTVSELLDGINYVATKSRFSSIVNMSLGLYDPENRTLAVDDAVKNVAADGMRFVISAGNEEDDANDYTPARVNGANIWTISASDINDNFANFSNYGNPPIEYAAPGVNVPSLRIGGSWGMGFIPGITGDEDGTSYAAPHVAGLLLATPNGIGSNAFASGDPDGNPDPIAEAILAVKISGPGTLNSGEQGTWTAIPINESSSVSYQWYYTLDHNDIWHATANYTDTFTYTFFNNSSEVKIAGVRVDISSSGESSSFTKTVYVSPGGDGCGDKVICK